jgi:hypothetical protein
MTDPKKFDLGYRPDSYWEAPDPVRAIVGDIKGDLRRQMVRDLLERGIEIEEELLGESASEPLRTRLGQIHPQWMGGEYLPDLLAGEVEIARLTLDSTTRDVYSVRARRREGRIRYRIVDEYETRWDCSRESSARPLTLGELVTLIDTATFQGYNGGDLTDALRDGCGGLPEEDADFVTVTSEFYPDLEAYYREKAAAWLADRRERIGWDEDPMADLEPEMVADPEEEDPEEDPSPWLDEPKPEPAAGATEVDRQVSHGLVAIRLRAAGSARETRRIAEDEPDGWTLVAGHGRHFTRAMVREILSHDRAAPWLAANPALPESLLKPVVRWAAHHPASISLSGSSPRYDALDALAERGILGRYPDVLHALIARIVQPHSYVTNMNPHPWRALRTLFRCPVLPEDVLLALDRRLSECPKFAHRRPDVARHPSASESVWAAMLERQPSDELRAITEEARRHSNEAGKDLNGGGCVSPRGTIVHSSRRKPRKVNLDGQGE